MSARCFSGLTDRSPRGRGRRVPLVGEASLRAGVGVDVRSETQVPAVRPGSSRAARSSGMPSMWSRSISPKPDVAVRHQRQRGEEVLAELAIGDPRRPLLGPLERERVDEDRPAAPELDVVGGGVAERESALERERLGLEGQERGVPEHPERPLVRDTR